MKNWKDNIHFVLAEPQEPGNIGSCARAIKNMDFGKLCLVNPPTVMTEEAERLAHNAEEILSAAEVFNTMEDAIHNKHYIVGTSRRRGRKRGAFIPVEEGARRIREIAETGSVALLFGREDRGLFNEEIEKCAFLMTIPSSRKHPSINLAQAVMIIAYELSKAGMNKKTSKEDSGALLTATPPKNVSQKELALLYTRFEDALNRLEYISPRNDYHYKKVIRNLKHCLGRVGLTTWEYNMFHGICQQIERKLPDTK